MLRATKLIEGSDARAAASPITITLTREDRYRRRVSWTTDCGLAFLLDLPEATYLPNGAGLVLEDGRVVRIAAASEPLLGITAASPTALARIAWHIGNRHTPAEITGTALFIQPDHVLADMVERLGGMVEEVLRPFEPEGGAGSLEKGHHHGHPHHEHRHGGHHHGHDHHGAANGGSGDA